MSRGARKPPKRKPCIKDGCGYPKFRNLQRCSWHYVASLDIERQVQAAEARLKRADGKGPRARVPESEWPPGERWCSGCQSFVPLWYATGSRCKACTSRAAHAARIEKVYGLSEDDYRALLELQDGRCYICRRKAHSRRLAVDHDHATMEVRGLLCADIERGCNHAILGNIADLAMARRIVEYLEDPPLARLRRSQDTLASLQNAPQGAVEWPAGW